MIGEAHRAIIAFADCVVTTTSVIIRVFRTRVVVSHLMD